MAIRPCQDLEWLESAADARVSAWLGEWPHHLELWPGWDTGPMPALERDLLYAVLDGCIRWHGGAAWHLHPAPCALWFPSGGIFQVAGVPGERPPVVRRLRWRVARGRDRVTPCSVHHRAGDPAPLLPLLGQIAAEHERRDRIAAERRRALTIAAATLFFDRVEPAGDDPWNGRLNELETTVARLLREDGSLPTPGDLARWCERSDDYFARRFRQHHGISPRVWLSRMRLREAARRLLTSGRSASAIAHDLGFEDPRVFNRAFRERYGLPPGRWRHQPGVAV